MGAICQILHDIRNHLVIATPQQRDPVLFRIDLLKDCAGHVSREMLNHYSHIRLEAKRQALAGLASRALEGLTSQSTSQNEKPAEAGFVTHSF
jgi:hypothetical protein